MPPEHSLLLFSRSNVDHATALAELIHSYIDDDDDANHHVTSAVVVDQRHARAVARAWMKRRQVRAMVGFGSAAWKALDPAVERLPILSPSSILMYPQVLPVRVLKVPQLKSYWWSHAERVETTLDLIRDLIISSGAPPVVGGRTN